MATIYVSNTAANGYAQGSDSNNGTSKQLAVLTLEKALTLVAAGDIIKVNDGIYQPPVANYWTFTKSVAIVPENVGQVVLQSSLGADVFRLFNINGGTAIAVYVSDIFLDGNNYLQAGILSNQTSNLAAIYLNRVVMQNFLYQPIKQGHASGAMFLKMRDCAFAGLDWRYGGVYMPNISQGGVDIDGLTIDQDGRNNSQGGIVYAQAIAPGVTAKVKNVTGISRLGATAGAFNFAGVRLQNINNALIEDCDITISGVGAGSAAATLYEISANAAGVQDSNYGKIIRCHGTNATAAGKTAIIGSDAYNAATINRQNYGIISECNLKGTTNSPLIHGPMLGYGIGGRIESCTTDYCGDGAMGLMKNQIADSSVLGTPLSVGNKGYHCATKAMYSKGSTGTIFANNTLVTSPGFAPIFEIADWNDSDTPHVMGANNTFINNVCTGDTAPDILAQQGTPGDAADTTSGTVFYGSYYDESLGPLTNKWLNGAATVYQDLASFNAAMADASYPCIIDALNLDANGDFTVDSPYLGSGYKFWAAGHRPVGNDGEPLSDIDTGVGHRQTKLAPFHPANLLIKV